MRILIVGGAGFVGRHLTTRLRSLEYEVMTLDVASSDIKKNLLDLTASDLEGFDWVVNLAAQTDVALAIASPRYTYEQNLLGTLALLEAVRYAQAKPRLMQISSESAYGAVPANRVPIREEESLNPPNAYSASKAAAEMAVQTYVRQYELKTAILRCSTMFGEGASKWQVVPKFISRALEGLPIEIEGGDQTRDFNYVGNTVEAMSRVIQSDVQGLWNVASGREVSIRELAEKIIELAGSKSRLVQKPWRPGEKGLRLVLSIDKAKRDLDYSPAVSLEEGLRRTIDWYKSN
jgi:UDP-glucose 4-epimerase